jgi:hypothetical protein
MSVNNKEDSRRAASSIRGTSRITGTGLMPVNIFEASQSDVKNLVSTCIESTSPSNNKAAFKEINQLHNEFDAKTSELQKCLNFFEHQLLMYLGTPFQSDSSAKKELQTFEEIRERRKMHETDDYENLVCKEAVENSMNAEEKSLITQVFIQN